MGDIVRRRFSRRDRLHERKHIGHSEGINDVIFLDHCQLLVTASNDKTMRTFCTDEMYEYYVHEPTKVLTMHDNFVRFIEKLGEDMFLSLGADNYGFLWSASKGQVLGTNHISLSEVAVACKALEGRRFAIATSRHLLFYEWNERFCCSLVKSIPISYSLTVKSMALYDENLVLAGPGGFAIYDVITFKLLFTVPSRLNITAVAANDELVVVGDLDGNVTVYETTNYRSRPSLNVHTDQISSIILCGSLPHILSSSWDKTIRLYDGVSGRQLWSTRFPSAVFALSISSGRRLAVGLSTGSAFTFFAPDDVSKLMDVEIVDPSQSAEFDQLPVLQQALMSCLAGEASPKEQCEKYINEHRCSVSFEEWQSAHKLLVMAVRDGDIPRSRDYRGEIAYWFENLYIAIKDVKLTSRSRLNAAKGYLRYAAELGLIEGVEGTLAALHVSRALKKEINSLRRSGVIIMERLAQVEGRVDRLKASYERYMRFQKYSCMFALSLQLIPIVGQISSQLLTSGSALMADCNVQDLSNITTNLGSGHDDGWANNKIFAGMQSLFGQGGMDPTQVTQVNCDLQACDLDCGKLSEIFSEQNGSFDQVPSTDAIAPEDALNNVDPGVQTNGSGTAPLSTNDISPDLGASNVETAPPSSMSGAGAPSTQGIVPENGIGDTQPTAHATDTSVPSTQPLAPDSGVCNPQTLPQSDVPDGCATPVQGAVPENGVGDVQTTVQADDCAPHTQSVMHENNMGSLQTGAQPDVSEGCTSPVGGGGTSEHLMGNEEPMTHEDAGGTSTSNTQDVGTEYNRSGVQGVTPSNVSGTSAPPAQGIMPGYNAHTAGSMAHTGAVATGASSSQYGGSESGTSSANISGQNIASCYGPVEPCALGEANNGQGYVNPCQVYKSSVPVPVTPAANNLNLKNVVDVGKNVIGMFGSKNPFHDKNKKRPQASSKLFENYSHSPQHMVPNLLGSNVQQKITYGSTIPGSMSPLAPGPGQMVNGNETPSSLRKTNVQSTTSIETLASVWAAHIVEYDDMRMSQYVHIRDCLLNVLYSERVSIDQIMNKKGLRDSVGSAANASLAANQRIGHFGLGDQERLVSFLSSARLRRGRSRILSTLKI